jgi:hypothetical protein
MYDPCQPIESPAEVDWFQSEEDLDTTRDHFAAPSRLSKSTSSTVARVNWSTPLPISSRAFPTWTTSPLPRPRPGTELALVVLGNSRLAVAGTTRASATLLAVDDFIPLRLKWLDHQASLVAEYPRSSQNLCASCPLARQASIRFAHSAAVVMHVNLRHVPPSRYTAP